MFHLTHTGSLFLRLHRELVAMHLKRQGQYICRTLSYHGCSFHVDEHALSADSLKVYDEAARFWIDLYAQLQYNLKNGDLQYFQRAEGANKQKQKQQKKSHKTSPTTLPSSKRSQQETSKATSKAPYKDASSSSDSDDSDCSSLQSSVVGSDSLASSDLFTSTDDSDADDSEEDGDRNRGNGSLRVAENEKVAISSINRYFWGKCFICVIFVLFYVLLLLSSVRVGLSNN